ncbi:MAG: right-handed parallel beta-helix repeat-containing protein [Bacteroidia bacterium]
MLIRRTFFLLAYLVIFSSSFAQQAWYVDPGGGNSQNGSLALPWQTLAYAATQVSVGDTIVLRAGNYTGDVTIATDDITVMSYPGEWAVVSAPINDSNQGWALWFNAAGGKVYNLELVGGYYYCIKIEAGNAIVKGSILHGSGRDCIKIVPNADNILIEQCEIYDSGLRDNSNAEGIDNVNADQMVVRGCYIHDIATNAVYGKGGARNCLIENNLIMDCGGGIQLGFFTDLQFFDPIENPNYHGNIDGIVRNNIVLRTEGPGIGMFAALRPVVLNNTLVEVAESSRGGIHFEPVENDAQLRYVVDPIVVNNVVTLSSNSSRTVIEDRNGGMTGNIELNYNRYHDADGNLTIRYGGGQVNWVQWQAAVPGGDPNSSVGDPLLNASFRPAVGSPLIDQGQSRPDLVLDYDYETRSGIIDIGADEVSSICPELSVPPMVGTIGTGPVCSGGTLPIEEENEESEWGATHFKIYPNPSQGSVWIDLPAENGQLVVYDLMGSQIAISPRKLTATHWQLDGLPSGYLLVRWIDPLRKRVYSKRIWVD